MGDAPELDSPVVGMNQPWRHLNLLRRIPRPLRHGITIFAALLFVEYVAIPSFLHSKRGSSLNQLGRVNFGWFLAGFALEAGACSSPTPCPTQSVLPKDGPGLSRVLRIDLSTLAVSHVIPGGTAGGTGLGYRLLTSSGVIGPDAAFALATQGIGSALVLNAMLWVALVISIPLHGFNSAYVTVVVVGAVLLAALGTLVLSLTRGEAHAVRALQAVARRVPWVTEEQMKRVVERLAARLRTLVSDRQLLKNAVLWAAANWLFDAASLWAFVAAYGHISRPIDLFVAYGVANVLAAVPLTPGGLGIVEAVAGTLLIGFGVPAGIAWLGVISWRLFNFGCPSLGGGRLPVPQGQAGRRPQRAARRGAGGMTNARHRRARRRKRRWLSSQTCLLVGLGLHLLRPRRHHLEADRDLEQLLEELHLALQHPALELGVTACTDHDLDATAAAFDPDVAYDRVVRGVQPVGDAQQGQHLQDAVPVGALERLPGGERLPGMSSHVIAPEAGQHLDLAARSPQVAVLDG